jgi:hypothetical protein
MSSNSCRPLFLLICSVCICHAQDKPDFRQPAWVNGPWSKDDPSFHAIRLKLDALKFDPNRSEDDIERLFKQNAVPAVAKLGYAARLRRPVDIRDIFWPVALQAYFPDQAPKYLIEMSDVLLSCPLKPSYEFARVAYCVFNEQAPFMVLRELADRLLDKDGDDLLVRINFVHMGAHAKKFNSNIHLKALAIAQQLQTKLKYVPNLGKKTLLEAYELYFLFSLTRSAYAQFRGYAEKLLLDPAISKALAGYCRMQLKYYKGIENKIGWKKE